MCQDYRWLISVGSFCGLIQSVLWFGFGITAALTYLCVLPVPPYENEDDFFRVTLVKLYFEGPQCIPDGSYLGKFNEDYRKLNLFTPDRVFSAMIAYVILNVIYFLLSLSLYLNRNNQNKRNLALSWSALTLILCGIDVILAYEIAADFSTLKDYMSEKDELEVIYSSAKRTLGDLPYISLVLALVLMRFFFFWLWNFLVGFFLFFDALCFRKIIGTPSEPKKKKEKKKEDKPNKEEELQQPEEDPPTSVSLVNGKYTSEVEIKRNLDYTDLKKSMEAVTRFFNGPENASSHKENTGRNRGYAPSEACWQSSKPHTSKEWEMTNEGYISDEQISFEPEKQFDFDHNLKNFESGQKKIKVVKPPMGKPVSIPVPPPLPTSGSCNC